MDKLFDGIKNNWNILAGMATWVLSILGTFLKPPAAQDPIGGESTWANLAKFVLTCLLALLIIPMLKYRSKDDYSMWRKNAFLALLFGLLAVGIYFTISSLWAYNCYGQTVVIGRSLTSHGQEYASSNRDKTTLDLLKDHQCKAEEVWTRDSIVINQQILGWTYIVSIWLSTLVMIAALQAYYCYKKE